MKQATPSDINVGSPRPYVDQATACAPPHGNVTVREAVFDDLRAVAPLFEAYRQFYGAAPDFVGAHAFLAQRQERRESTLLVAFDSSEEAQAIGFAHLYPSFSSVSLQPIVILNDLYVAPEYRRTSVARRLITAVIAHAAQAGAVRLELATQLTNKAARQLYSALGFVPDHEFTHLSYPLSDFTAHRID